MKKFSLILLTCAVGAGILQAEIMTSPTWGYTLDMPEGFELIDKTGNERFLFSSTVVPVQLIVSVYPPSRYGSAEQALEDMREQLSAEARIAGFRWREQGAAIGQLTFPVPGNKPETRQKYQGWMEAVELPGKQGILILIAYTTEEQAGEYEHFIISTLDAVYTDRGSRFETGPMTAFVWPAAGEQSYPLTIRGKTVTVTLDADDGEANQFVVDREFEVLKLYLGSKHWRTAWQRYYRAIYRDAYKRLERAGFDIFNALCYGENPVTGDEELTAALLEWTQGFTYTRVPEGSDFISLPRVLTESTGDCDSRALLLAILLNQMNLDTVLFISPEYSHALAGFAIEGSGARMETDLSGAVTGTGRDGYLVGETTANVPPGQVAQDMADPGKWFAVIFPQ
ncbi:MAG: hypothetical protein LBR47_00585 [Spirochaetaceae bacterium]|nr:hypothetical protein [Spirochaetaceae bacterium]